MLFYFILRGEGGRGCRASPCIPIARRGPYSPSPSVPGVSEYSQQILPQLQSSWHQHEMPHCPAPAVRAAGGPAAATGGSAAPGVVVGGSHDCWYCPYRSRYRSNLNRHMKKLHDINLPRMGPGRKPMYASFPPHHQDPGRGMGGDPRADQPAGHHRQ